MAEFVGKRSMKWEYKIVELNKYKDANGSTFTTTACLDHLGNEGWELICTRWDEGSPMLGFFKRPKKEETSQADIIRAMAIWGK